MKKAPQIIVQNNTGSFIPVNLFNAPAAGGTAGSINARIVYTWNVTSLVYVQINVVSIQAKTSPAGSFVTYQATGSFQNVQDIVAALNSLNIGQFYIDDISIPGNTLIKVANDIVIYNNLNVTSTLGFTVTWQINLFVVLTPPFAFSVLDVTLGSTSVFAGPANQVSGSTFISAPDAVIGHNYLFQAGWPNDIFRNSTNTLYRNGVQIQQTIMFDLFGGCNDVLPAYDLNYSFVIDVT